MPADFRVNAYTINDPVRRAMNVTIDSPPDVFISNRDPRNALKAHEQIRTALVEQMGVPSDDIGWDLHAHENLGR